MSFELDSSIADDDRFVELNTISTIYPELIINAPDYSSASIEVPVEPLKPLAVNFCATEGPAATQPDINLLSYLPALSVQIILPNGYPTQSAPIFHIHASPSWIPESRIQQLEDAGPKLWEEMGRDQVIFTYLDYLREEGERVFSLLPSDSEYLTLPPSLKPSLLNTSTHITRTKFSQTTFDCETCMVPKKGTECHRLPCDHVSCIQCLQDYFNTCITEGNVAAVKCMDCDSAEPLDAAELLSIPLSQEQVERYTTLLLKKKHDADPSTVYCPRKWCAGIARTTIAPEHHAQMREGRSHIPRSQRLGICHDCSFAFCIHCSASWHGALIWCSDRLAGELSAEERASEAYVLEHSTRCPWCGSATQKTRGCNHMICGTCKNSFCYLCSAKLEDRDPYRHFNSESAVGECKGRLWERDEDHGA